MKRQYNRILGVLLFVLLFAVDAVELCAKNKYPFIHYTYENGLASNWITSITQDKDGFMWFGTSNGLCRFDGYAFRTFKNILGDKTSLGENFVSSVAEDTARNCLWVVTTSGISKYNKISNTFKNYKVSSTLIGDYTPFTDGSVCVDSKGNVWVIGFNEGYTEGLFKYLPESDQFKNVSLSYKELPNKLRLIKEDNAKRLWFGTDEGLFYYDDINDSFEQIPYKSEDGTPLDITALYSDSKNRLWIGTHQNPTIYLFDGNKISTFYTSDFSTDDFNWISSISDYDENILLVGIKDFGVLALNKNDGTSEILQPDLFNPNSVNSKNPLAIYTDKFGNVWVGSYNSGINFIDKNKKQFDLYRFNYKDNGLLSNNVRAFFQDSDGDIWVGTKQGGGLSKFYPETGVFDNYKADDRKKNWLDNDIVICINELEPGKLLVGTYGNGIYLFDKKSKTFRQFAMPGIKENTISDKYVYAIYKDRDNHIWIGSNSNTDIYYPDEKVFKHTKGLEYARCFLDIGNKVLIGTWTKGLFIYDKSKQVAENYIFKDPELNQNRNVRINGLAQDKNGLVWLATNHGLVCYDEKNGTDHCYTENDGIADEYTCAVLVDDHNNIWTSTKGGLSKFSQEETIFKNYDQYDGLQSTVFEEFVSLKTKDGFMLFSGTNGFNIFHPDKIVDNTRVPNVFISEMKILNEDVKIGKKGSPLSKHISLTDYIELKYAQSSFSFEFAAINFTSPEKTQYKYILEGYDNDWIEADDRRIATFTRLPAGEYTFKVIASNSDGLWNKEGASIRIKIKPPFWESRIAYVIYFFIILSFLLGFNRIVAFRTNQKNRLNDEIRENKRLEQMSRNRLRFFTNISHELRTPLTLIAAPLQRLVAYETDDIKLKTTLNIMNRNAQRLLRLVNQLMDFRRVEENRIHLKVSPGDIEQMLTDITFSFNDIALSKRIRLESKVQIPEPEKVWFDSGLIEKCVYNLLSNAIKFTGEGGVVMLEAFVKQNKLTIKVTDTGIGIAPEVLDRIFERFYTTDHVEHNLTGAGIGLSFTKSLVELHHGTIMVESKLNNGSCFTFVLPVNKEEYSDVEIEEQNINYRASISQIINETAAVEQDSSVEEIATNKEVVMIVEDNDDLRDYLVASFDDYQVIACRNGKEGLQEAKENMPDIILSDIMMPEMDGLELCDAIKSNFITSHIPVVLLTAKASAENKIEGLKHKADAYIEKPFDLEMLLLQVANLIQLRKNIKVKFSSSDLLKTVEESVLPLDKVFLDKAQELIEKSISNTDLSVESLSADLGMSRSQLFRKFKALTNTTPSQFIRTVRLKKAAELLSNHMYNVNEVALMVGFVDSSHFIASFKKYFGLTPKQFSEERRKH